MRVRKPQVKTFDVQEAEELLRQCPKQVREYVRLLKENLERQKGLTALAINKLREQGNP